MSGRERVRVALVDDEALMRSGIRLVLEGDPRIEVVVEAVDGREAIEAVALAKPDVVLMDIRMPVMNGIDAVRVLRSTPGAGHIPVVMLTAFDTDTYILDALRAGAVGFLLKSTPPAALIAAVHAAVEGQQLLSSDVLASLVALAGEPESEAGASRSKKLAQLSEREREIAELVAEGVGNLEIASRLFIAPTTVKTHMRHIMEKLGAENRVQVAVAVLEGR